jgi:hypothetical protein
MLEFTSEQEALFLSPTAEQKLAVEIGTTTPQRFCSGTSPVTIASNLYRPKVLSGNRFDLTGPRQARTRLQMADVDGALRTYNYLTQRFSGKAVDVHILLREPPTKTWTLCVSVEWTCEQTFYTDEGIFVIQLFAAAGHRPRAGLEVGTRAAWAYAPDANETIKIKGSSVHFYHTTYPSSEPDEPSTYPIRRPPGRFTAGDRDPEPPVPDIDIISE